MNDTKKSTCDWIESVLRNDEESSDAALIDYFMHGGVNRETAILAVSQRDNILYDINYRLEI
jgi:hypothetical protein